MSDEIERKGVLVVALLIASLFISGIVMQIVREVEL